VSAVATRPAPVELLERPERPGGPVSLEERLELVLADVRRLGVAECPVCASEMTPSAAGAGCATCGATLS
jgi:hypothetical protein